MRCFGRKKNLHRCKNGAKFLFFVHHKFQVFALLVGVGTAIIWITELSESIGFKKPIEVVNFTDIPEYNQEQSLKVDNQFETIVLLLNYRAEIILNKLPALEDKSCSSYNQQTIAKFKELHKKNIEAIKSRNFVLSHELTREIHSLLYEAEVGGCLYDRPPNYEISKHYAYIESMPDDLIIPISTFERINKAGE